MTQGDQSDSVRVPAAALKHIASWARAGMCALRSQGHAEVELAALHDSLEDAERRWDDVHLSRDAAEVLFELDRRSHGYGTNRALIGTRDDCDHCRALGVALEELLPRLAVQRAKRAA